MDLDLNSSEPLIITPTSNNNHLEKQHGENPSNSSTVVSLDFRRHRSLDGNRNATYQRSNRTKSKMSDISQELAEVSRRLTERKKLQTRWSVIHCSSILSILTFLDIVVWWMILCVYSLCLASLSWSLPMKSTSQHSLINKPPSPGSSNSSSLYLPLLLFVLLYLITIWTCFFSLSTNLFNIDMLHWHVHASPRSLWKLSSVPFIPFLIPFLTITTYHLNSLMTSQPILYQPPFLSHSFPLMLLSVCQVSTD